MTRLLMSASFEERSVDVARYASRQLRPERVEVISYLVSGQSLSKKVKQEGNVAKIQTIFRAAGIESRVNVIPIDCEFIYDKVDQSADVLDVSGFTKYHSLSLLANSSSQFSRVIYAHAASHKIPTGDVEQTRILQVPGYNGRRVANRPDVLFLLAGFEGGRALTVYKSLAVSKAVLCVGVPWFEPERLVKYVRTVSDQNASLMASTNVVVETVPSTDAWGFRDRFVGLVKRYRREFSGPNGRLPNVIAVPLGTKLQAVGLYLSLRDLPEMQVLYPFPTDFEELAIGTGSVSETSLTASR